MTAERAARAGTAALAVALGAGLAVAGVCAAAGTGPAAAPAGPGPEEMYDLYGRVLSRVVGPVGNLRWAVLAAEHADLDRFVGWLASDGPETTPRSFPDGAATLAYWLNAYNALVLHGVLAHYPVGSVKEIPGREGFFRDRRRRADGKTISLDEIETLVRTRFSDPRVHFVLNCAAKSCAPHARDPIRPAAVEDQLSAAQARVLENERFVRLDATEGEIWLSKIFEWHATDFVGAAGKPADGASALVAYLRPRVSEIQRGLLDARTDWKVRFFEYDWSLNEAKTR